jgi:hypothetical protein
MTRPPLGFCVRRQGVGAMSSSYKPDPDAWRPSKSPWDRILPDIIWMTQRHDLENIFGGIREFVVKAAGSPALADRFVFPSTINMTIFETAAPVNYSESYLHPRFIISPHGPGRVRLRYYRNQEIKPELRWDSPSNDEPGEVKLRIARYSRGEPKPVVTWIIDADEAINIIADYFGN